MKAVVQRVAWAAVEVGEEEVGRIGEGLLVYLGCVHGDGEAEAAKMARRLAKLRIFEDEAGRTNLDLQATGGAVLVVSQFTLAADTAGGNRPSFSGAQDAATAAILVNCVQDRLKEEGFQVESGRFGATMRVSSLNRGPATYLLDIPPASTTE
jgi:D-tyrosyl-tRNA(Tyr) deacylase